MLSLKLPKSYMSMSHKFSNLRYVAFNMSETFISY